MKNTIKTAVLIAVMAVPTWAVGGLLDQLVPGLPKKDEAKIDVVALTGRGTLMIAKVSRATIALGEAVMETAYAVGNAAAAEKLKGAIENAKAKNDESTTKVLVGEVNNAVGELDKIDLQAKMDAAKARASMGKALLNLGVGMLLDASAVSDAKGLTTDSINALTAVKASPMQYGPSAVVNVQSAMAAAMFTTENIPPQLASVATFTTKLKEYAQTNKIEVPSKEQIEQTAKTMEKE